MCFRKRNGTARGYVLWLYFLFSTIQPLQGAEFSEDQIKAVYLFNFAAFIRWPDNAFSENPDTFYFCALTDQSPVIAILRKVINGETARGRKLVVRVINNQDDLKNCQLLYFQASEKSRLVGFLPKLKGRNILTVSDADGFAERDGMISIIRHAKRLRPVINIQRLERAGLKASAKLLRLAFVVDGGKH